MPMTAYLQVFAVLTMEYMPKWGVAPKLNERNENARQTLKTRRGGLKS